MYANFRLFGFALFFVRSEAKSDVNAAEPQSVEIEIQRPIAVFVGPSGHNFASVLAADKRHRTDGRWCSRNFCWRRLVGWLVIKSMARLLLLLPAAAAVALRVCRRLTCPPGSKREF